MEAAVRQPGATHASRAKPLRRFDGSQPIVRGPQPALARRLAVASCVACLLTSGCATLRRTNASSDALGACRQLSREGVAALERGDAGRARDLLDQAVAASPTDVDARRQFAEALWQSGSPTQASAHMDAAVDLDPRHGPTIVRSGEMLLGLGNVDRALERAEEAILLDATLGGAWALRGRAFRQRDELERALADMQQALRFNPRAPDILQDAAELQYELGRPQRCLTTLQCLLETYAPGEEPQRLLWLEGLAYAAVNRTHDAVDRLYAASQRGPAEPELLYHLARAQTAAGQRAAAAATARQAADAGHEGGRSLLAQLLATGADDANGTFLR